MSTSASPQVVPCHQCGGYRTKGRRRVGLSTRSQGKVTLLITLLVVTLVAAFRLRRCYHTQHQHHQKTRSHNYDRWLPLIFIGGVPGSGSSLLRVFLHANPDISCSPETRVIPQVLGMYNYWLTNDKEHARLEEAGVTLEVLQSAVSAMVLEILTPRDCSQEPLSIHHALHLSQLFPHSKFLWVVRDGRAVVYSLLSRQMGARGLNVDIYRGAMKQWSNINPDMRDQWSNTTATMLEQWNNATIMMLEQCQRVGPSRCKAVHYEQLLLKPRRVLPAILRFLNATWDESVMRLYTHSGGVGPVRYSSLWEDSKSWEDGIPMDVLSDVSRLAPVMAHLGYDPADLHPNYLGFRTLPSHLADMFIGVDNT